MITFRTECSKVSHFLCILCESFICSHLLEEEASLAMVEQYTDV